MENDKKGDSFLKASNFQNSRGYTCADVIILGVVTRIGLKLRLSSSIETYFRNIPPRLFYLPRNTVTCNTFGTTHVVKSFDHMLDVSLYPPHMRDNFIFALDRCLLIY